MNYLEIINLNKSYDDNLILDKVNYRFKKGEFNALVGPSGIGKTSLLNILIGIDEDYSGKIIGMEKNKSIVFQENRLLENYSIKDNLNFVLNNPLDDNSINEYLQTLNLNVDASAIVNQLSGGMKRRISILRAVLKKSDIYIFDEPFKDMDHDTHLLVLEFIKRTLKGKTLIFSTHSDLDIKILKPYIIKI